MFIVIAKSFKFILCYIFWITTKELNRLTKNEKSWNFVEIKISNDYKLIYFFIDPADF